MPDKQSYKPPPPGWTKRALTQFDCSEFASHTTPIIFWVIQGEPDVDWLATTLRSAITKRAPWLRGRLAKTESGVPKYELHVAPLDTDIEFLSVTSTSVTEAIHNSVPYQAYGSIEAFAGIPKTEFTAEILGCPTDLVDGPEGYIRKDEPLLRLHYTRGPDAGIISVAFSHCLFDGLGFSHIQEAWRKEMSGVEWENPIDTLAEKPETFFDFTKDVEIEPDFVPTGWIPATRIMYAQAVMAYFKRRYLYRPHVQCKLLFPRWLVERWKHEAQRELPKNQYVTSNDLVLGWLSKHITAIYPPSERVSLISTICLRMRCPQFPAHLITNSSTSYVLPDDFTGQQLRDMSLAQVALAFRKATAFYENPDNVVREMTFEYRRMLSCNGGKSMLPLVRPRQNFFILDSFSGMKIEKMDFNKRGVISDQVAPDQADTEKPTKPPGYQQVKTLTSFVWYGEGLQIITNDVMGGFQFSGLLPKAAFENMQKALEREAGRPKPKL